MKRWAWTASAAARTRGGGGAQFLRVPLPNVDAVEAPPPPLRVVEAQEQADDRGLAGGGRAHEGQAAPGLDHEVDVPQDPLLLPAAVAGGVGEGHSLERNLPLHGRGLPRVCGARDPGLGVEELEDPLRGGHCRLEHVELLREVGDWPPEPLRVLEKRDEDAEGETPEEHLPPAVDQDERGGERGPELDRGVE